MASLAVDDAGQPERRPLAGDIVIRVGMNDHAGGVDEPRQQVRPGVGHLPVGHRRNHQCVVAGGDGQRVGDALADPDRGGVGIAHREHRAAGRPHRPFGQTAGVLWPVEGGVSVRVNGDDLHGRWRGRVWPGVSPRAERGQPCRQPNGASRGVSGIGAHHAQAGRQGIPLPPQVAGAQPSADRVVRVGGNGPASRR